MTSCMALFVVAHIIGMAFFYKISSLFFVRAAARRRSRT